MVIPYIIITENWETVEGKDKMVLLAGVGLITPQGFKGFINKDKMLGLRWMNNKTKQGEVTFSINSDVKDVITVKLEKIKVKVKPVLDGDTREV